jgi:SAM-dependent methyltransferase
MRRLTILRRGVFGWLLAILAALGLTLVAQAQTAARPLDVPFVPTPEDVVVGMLRLANVKRSDVVYDLGSGDGRIVIQAAKRYGARGVGIDINPERIEEASRNARAAKVADRVRFLKQDLFDSNLSEATVVTLYLLPRLNLKLRPKLLAELKPGTRVVSHGFDMGDWTPDRTAVVGDTTIYLWTIK